MVCTFYHKNLGCLNAYCYYPRSDSIDCPVKKEHIEKIGEIYPIPVGSINSPPNYKSYGHYYRKNNREDR